MKKWFNLSAGKEIDCIIGDWRKRENADQVNDGKARIRHKPENRQAEDEKEIKKERLKKGIETHINEKCLKL